MLLAISSGRDGTSPDVKERRQQEGGQIWEASCERFRAGGKKTGGDACCVEEERTHEAKRRTMNSGSRKGWQRTKEATRCCSPSMDPHAVATTSAPAPTLNCSKKTRMGGKQGNEGNKGTEKRNRRKQERRRRNHATAKTQGEEDRETRKT
jgi:hypothetical protein